MNIIIGILIGIGLCVLLYLCGIIPIVKKLKTQIKSLEDDCDKLNNARSILNGEISNLTDQKNLICEKIIENEKKLTDSLEKLNKNHIETQEIEEEISTLKTERATLEAQKDQYISITIPQLQAQAESTYRERMALMDEKYDRAVEQISNQLFYQQEECKDEYLKTLAESKDHFCQATQEMNQEIETLKATLERLRSVVSSGIEDSKRADDIAHGELKYQLQISDDNLVEIHRLKEVLPYLKEQRPLRKMIWEGYYRDLTTDLLSRILDTSKTSGIYKITNLTDKRVYIGQAVNLSDRIKTHIKAGLGIDTNNSELYKAMLQIGVENFSFEILEYCNASDLNDREKFWIDYYHSTDYGYNQTRGGSASR